MMAVGLALFCLRYVIPEDAWSDRAAKLSFWSLNLGLALMVFATLFPLGILQLYHSLSVGYFDARSLSYRTNRTNTFLEWLRLPGDAVFILGGALPVLYLALLGVLRQKLQPRLEQVPNVMLTEVVEAAGPRVHTEVLLALLYAFFLMGVALLLELLGRRSERRTEGYRNSGFIYFHELDYWECPAGHRLVQLETDHRRRIAFYRAPASACNSCSLKLNCTDSDTGRLLQRRLDPWFESEIRRFHRAISLTLLFLVTILLLAETLRYSQRRDREPLVGLLLALGLVQLKLLPSLPPRAQTIFHDPSP